ncbi:esteraselipase/thioesterase protein [Ketogulonicigenium robustum]|uniref:Esteraselipase/thioesterase protein n=1 Tax=Ketogulonicigenium robustum TaxID=92947 RepID=A0A1W6P1T0_9RHOB|nr:alpha/beta hydrolase [Ketogulonicigenium robustum]ARO15383.1 esteraselipase/thioesterase protein [Ketogulonicigenium robustum]
MTYTARRTAGLAGHPLVVTLHGTGGDENQFHDFGGALVAGAHVTSPRGDVSENGALRYFRRVAEGQYDMADLQRAVDKLAAFIADERTATGAPRVIALGYSNGANVLAALSFQHPDLVDDLALLHPLIPFDPPPVDFTGRRVLITAGKHDAICPSGQTVRLADYYAHNHADLSLFWNDGGHSIAGREIEAIRAFVAQD